MPGFPRASSALSGSPEAALGSQCLASVRGVEAEPGTGGYDPCRVDARVASVIMMLDVVHVDGAGDAGVLIEIPQVARKGGVILNPAQIAFEMPDIDRIESYKRRE